MGNNRRVDRAMLNVDAGEQPDEPEELYRLAHLVNVACGGHAGDDASMDRVIAVCMQSGTRVGAHPSYEDREEFGRRAQAIAPDAVERMVHDQCAGLAARARAAGTTAAAMKPHGALYHAAGADPALARATVAGATRALGPDAAIVGMPGSALEDAARDAGRVFWGEGFADRGVLPNGALVPRGEPGALVHDPAAAAARAAELALAGVATVCVHGDTDGALAIARAVRRVLDVVAPVEAFGDEAWRWRLAPTADRRALEAALRALPGVRDVIVAEEHACVVGERPDLRRIAPLAEVTAPPRALVIQVRYDGEDLDAVAAHAGLAREEVIALHAGRAYTVSLVGFLPGFAYLRAVDARIALPRRATPRPRVPAGAVGIGATYTGVYPLASPGGWWLVGTAVGFTAFDGARGAALALGDHVRFERVP